MGVRINNGDLRHHGMYVEVAIWVKLDSRFDQFRELSRYGGKAFMRNVSAAAATTAPEQIVTERAVRLLASSIFKQLREEGCHPKDIINVSSQLIDMVTVALRDDDEDQAQ